jgi:hypothetical protein
MNESDLDVAGEARRIYENSLRAQPERDHRDDFVAIEPVSGEYFLGKSLSDWESAGQIPDATLACVACWTSRRNSFWHEHSMNAHIDHSGRALLKLSIRASDSSVGIDVDVWIDTGFTGELVDMVRSVA